MTKQRVNVLFPTVGRRVELVRCFQRAYHALGLEGHVIGLDMDPLAPALQVVDRPYVVPRMSSPDYFPTLLELCRRESADLILPLIDADIEMLDRHRDELAATGARVAVAPPAAIALTRDKWRTTEFFRRLGLATPASWLPADIRPDIMPYPLFIKPRGGNGGKDAYRVNDARELAFFLRYVAEPIVQECLSGPEITTDVVCDLEGAVLGVVSRRRIEVRLGEVAKGVTMLDWRILNACVRIAHALPAAGPITVQCFLHEDVPHFTEINARVGGGLPLGIAAGVDAPRLLLATTAGLPTMPPRLGDYRTDLYMTRFDDSFMLTAGQRAELAQRVLPIEGAAPARTRS
jgi:carbamoyl-phosphate synthase large subunit